ncbi:hypothetical protein N7540_011040 [Penicillium herquei]|nr:hypothetical protein N7540_011040 [Penicillium herquei]
MPSTKFNVDAQQDFEDLVKWVKDAQMEPERGKRNRLVCVDKGREEKVRPFLVKLGYAKVPHLASLQRICGDSSIDKPDDKDSVLVFPLSIAPTSEGTSPENIQVSGVVLEPGTYVRLTKTLQLNAFLDYLMISLQ